MIMSGVDDGTLLKFNSSQGDGQMQDGHWVISLGRHDNNDICLNNDTFVSRHHARIHVESQEFWLEDCDSTNGTYVEILAFEDEQVMEVIPLASGQLFRVGRTWLRIESF
jgi:pSer/pThr/pTyr-binding forkhead associated (FHA) protein